MAEPEVIYAIRRTDGEPVCDYGWVSTDLGDWTLAEEDAAYADLAVEYEMVKMTVERVAVRTLPLCKQCDQPSANWGLCEQHAREDDPVAVEADRTTDG